MLSLEYIKQRLAEGIPKGIVLAEHSETGHFYRHVPTNLLLGSVTTKSSSILDNPHLKKWSSRLAAEYLLQKIGELPLMKRTPENMVTFKDAAILVHQDEFEDAGGVGTAGHKIIDVYLEEWIAKNERPSKDITTYITAQDPRLWAITRSAMLFMEDYYVIPIASELLVANVKDKSQKYAGTLDGLMLVIMPQPRCPKPPLIGEKNFHVWMHRSSKNPLKMQCANCGLKADYQFALTDWKTSNSIDKPDYAMQVSAYKKALTAMTGLKPRLCLIIRLDKKQAKYEVMQVLNPDNAYKAFKKVAGVYDWLHDGESKLFPCNQKEIISLK